MTTATEIKRHIGKDGLFLADVDGVAWATNRFWLTPARQLAPLLDKFNVDEHASGAYDVNGTIHKRSDDAPQMGAFLDITKYTDTLTRVRTDYGNAYSRTHDGEYLALFTRGNGSTVGVRADWLDWLCEAQAPYGERYGSVVLATDPDKPAGAIAITADREVSHGGHYDDNRHYVPQTWESAGPVILAIVMPCKSA